MQSDSSRSFPIVEFFFVGGVGDEVTASSVILKIRTSDDHIAHIMIDAGAAQGEDEFRNFDYPITGSEINAIVLTHSHYDHIGDLALLHKSGFTGKIYITDVAKRLSYPMLVDAAGIQEHHLDNAIKRARKVMRETTNRITQKRLLATKYSDMKSLDSAVSQLDAAEYEPLYTQEDIEAVKQMFRTVEPATYVEVMEGITICMLPTTHQNGAVRVEVHVKDPNGSRYGIAFTGDIGPGNSLLYEQLYDYSNENIDCLVLESLHGVKEPVETLETSIKRLYEIIRKAKRQKKHVVLMGYSLDRNAQLIYLMNCLRRMGTYIDVVIDAPLTMTELGIYQSTYSRDSEWFKDLGDDPFDTDNFRVIQFYRDHVESVLHGEAPRVIITASANGKGGRIIDYFENCLQRDDYIFVVCGWVGPDTPSRLILECDYGKKVELLDRTYVKRCKAYWLHGFSSHGYYPEMEAAVKDYPNVKTVILNHARMEDKLAVGERLQEFFDGEILMPKLYDAYELSADDTVILDEDNILLDFDGVIDRRVVLEEYDREYAFVGDDTTDDA